MGMDVEVRLRFVVKNNESPDFDDSEERLLGMMLKLVTEGALRLEPATIERDSKLNYLLCTANSYLRTKTGAERYLDQAAFGGSFLPGLCERYGVAAEIWTRCGEIGYDEHIVIDYDGSIVVNDTFTTTPLGVLCDKPPEWKPCSDEMKWNAEWGNWTIQSLSEYAKKELVNAKVLKTIEDEGMPF